MIKTLVKTPTGAWVAPESIDALYPDYKPGSNNLNVYAVVNGIDIVIEEIPVSLSNGGIIDATAKANEFIEKFIDRNV